MCKIKPQQGQVWRNELGNEITLLDRFENRHEAMWAIFSRDVAAYAISEESLMRYWQPLTDPEDSK